MFNRKSAYVLNKKEASAIIYADAFGNAIQLTADDFDSVKEFRKWKNESDLKNHFEEKKDYAHHNHTVSLPLMEKVVGAIPCDSSERSF